MLDKNYKRYVLLVLSTVYLLSFMDRWMIALFMQPIKEEFQLSDTQLGFISGIAFALFYATVGIPMARWADRGNRITITSLAIAFWAGMVMLCASVTNFVQLVLVRIGAAIGESGVMPPGYSLIADYFSPAERPRAVSIYMMSVPVSILVSLMLAGWVGEHLGWRAAFVLVAIPGLLMAVVAKLTLREPRILTRQKKVSPQPLLPFKDVIGVLWRRQSFRYLLLGLTLVNFVGIGVGQWYGTFFIRNHGMSLGDLGIWLGITNGLGGVVGVYLGGHISSRYLANDIPAQIRMAAVSPILFFVLVLAMLLSPSRNLSLVLLFAVNTVMWLPAGPIYAVILQLVESRMRATAMAILSLAINLIGMGFGPQTVGLMSDFLTPSLQTDALRAAMLISALISFGVTYCYWIAIKKVNADLSPSQPHKCSPSTESARMGINEAMN